MTKISIITPMYNTSRKEYNKTMASIHKQTVTDFEWIIVDDGTEYNFDDDRLFNNVHILNNYGPSVARNVGFQISQGDYIIYVDMGDELDPKRVENIIKCFEENPMYTIVFSPYTLVDDKEHFYNLPVAFHNDADLIREFLQKQNVCIPLGFAHMRWIWYLVGGFQPGIVCGEDGIFLRRAINEASVNGIGFDPNTAGTYYIDNEGQSRTQRRFEMGGFAFDGSRAKEPHGQYLDRDWFKNYHSKNWYDKDEEDA